MFVPLSALPFLVLARLLRDNFHRRATFWREGNMLYRARYLASMDGPLREHAALRVQKGRIIEVGKSADLRPLPGEEVWDGPRHILMPGLINAHAHLELHALRGQLPPGRGFASWVKSLRQLTADHSEADWMQSCRLGAMESLRHGTTTVVDVGNSGATCAAVADLPLRVFACHEVIGLDPALADSRLQQTLHRLEKTPNGPLVKKSIVPHSGYSVSLPLLKAIGQLHLQVNSKNGKTPGCYTVHAGESRDEEELFAQASGDLQTFCESIYLQAPRHSQLTALRYLTDHALLPERALIVHANGEAWRDASRLQKLRAIIVHCPQSHDFFSNPPFAAEAWMQAGILIALGTDSLASGASLSLWEAMRRFSSKHPQIPASTIAAMATSNAGIALDPQGELGRLIPGGHADLIGVQLGVDKEIRNEAESEAVFQELVHATTEVALSVVAGEPVLI